jgi:hypothetical protein
VPAGIVVRFRTAFVFGVDGSFAVFVSADEINNGFFGLAVVIGIKALRGQTCTCQKEEILCIWESSFS